MRFFTNSIQHDYTLAHLLLLIVPFGMLNIGLFFSIFKITSFVSDLFKGTAAAGSGMAGNLAGAIRGSIRMIGKQIMTAALPPIERAARQEYEYYGSTLTTNTALKITVVILACAISVMAWALARAANAAAHVKPLVIRVNEVGRAEALAYQDFAYRPQAPEIRYFLRQFVVGYYSRNHKTVAQQYVNSLYFLDRALFSAIDARDRKSQWLPKFLTSADDDIDVAVNNVVIEDLQTEPYRARVEFSKIFSNSSGSETRRERWAAEFVFRINPDVPNELILHNPLGIAITYFREGQAFN